MKRFIAALALVTALAAVAGAQAKDIKSFKDKTLNIALFQGGFGREYFDAVVAEFEKDYPGVRVNVVASPKIWDVVRPQVVAGNPPDFLYLTEGDQGGLVAGLIKDRGLLDLTDVFAGKAIDQGDALKDLVLPGILDSRACSPYNDGKIYLAPYNYTVMGLWYNKTFFDKNGIKPPKTWDDFFALNDTAKKYGRALFTYQGIYPGYLEQFLFPAIYSAGGNKALQSMFSLDPNFWTTEPAKKAAGIFGKIASTDNALMSGTVALNHTQSQTAFMQGKSMFCVNGSWFESEMKDAPREDGFQFGFAGVPAFMAGEKVASWTSTETFLIPAKAKNAPLAKEFLRYLYTKKSVLLNGEKAGGVYAVKGAVDLVKEKITPATYNAFKAVEEGMINVTGLFAVLPKGSKLIIKDEVFNPITSIMNRQMTTDQYLAQLDKVWKQAAAEIKAAK